MSVRMFLGSAALLLALVALGGLPGKMPEPALAQGPDKESAKTKVTFLDLTPFFKGKTLDDGTHLVKTLDGGGKISIKTKNNEVEEVIFTEVTGQQVRKKLARIQGNKVPLDYEIPDDLPTPDPGNHWRCQQHSYNVVDSKGHVVEHHVEIVCKQVPDLIDPFK